MMVALLIVDMLGDLGYEVIGPAMRLDRALKAAQEAEFDFAILDINLSDMQSFPVADVLRERGIPFIFASGYGSNGLNESYKDWALLRKPFELADLTRVLPSALPENGTD
jgi:CheY-like chemotaxis protein